MISPWKQSVNLITKGCLVRLTKAYCLSFRLNMISTRTLRKLIPNYFCSACDDYISLFWYFPGNGMEKTVYGPDCLFQLHLGWLKTWWFRDFWRFGSYSAKNEKENRFSIELRVTNDEAVYAVYAWFGFGDENITYRLNLRNIPSKSLLSAYYHYSVRGIVIGYPIPS